MVTKKKKHTGIISDPVNKIGNPQHIGLMQVETFIPLNLVQYKNTELGEKNK